MATATASTARGATRKINATKSQPTSGVDIAAAFTGHIKRVRVEMIYRLGMLLAAVVMVALPVLYVAIIAGFVWLIYLHLVSDVGMITVVRNGRAMIFMLILYLAPLIAGVILLIFMIKPLFAKRERRGKPLAITRQEEPALFAAVDQLCAIVGARTPSRINVDVDVNASASFREGVGGFLRKDLVLTIGLPMVAGLTARQFVGVLAHPAES